MLKAFKYKLNLNKTQQLFLNQSFGCVRFVYNQALTVKIQAYQKEKVSISCNDLIKILPSLKQRFTWLKDVDAASLQQSIRNLDSAYSNFFKQNKGFPKYKSKHNKQSIRFVQSIDFDFTKNKLKLPKIGWIKFFANKPFAGTIKSITVSKNAVNHYYASVLVETHINQPNKLAIEERTTIGIDIGLKDFAILSDRTVINNPKYLQKGEARLKVLQRRLSKKVKGSNRRNIAKLRVAKQHYKISNRRKDFLHKLSAKLVTENQSICIEDLNVKGMMKNHKLSKAIASVSWSTFFTMLQYKCDWYGKNLIKIGRFEASSKTCSCCGWVNKELTLADREWCCFDCSVIHDRDLNAALNIKKFGLNQINKITGLVKPIEDREMSTLVGSVNCQDIIIYK